MSTTGKLGIAALLLLVFVAGAWQLGLLSGEESAPPASPPVAGPSLSGPDGGGPEQAKPPGAIADSAGEGEWTLRVVVRNPSDYPVYDAALVFLDPDGRRVAEGRTDVQGQARLLVRGPGRLGVVAAYHIPKLLPLMVSPESREKELTVKLETGPGISGVVLDQYGAPLSRGRRVRVLAVPVEPNPWYAGLNKRRWSATTKIGGRFRIGNLPPGQFRLKVSERKRPSAGRPPEMDAVAETGNRDVVIQLAPSLGLRFHLLDSETGEAVVTGVTKLVLFDGEGQGTSTQVSGSTTGTLIVWDLPGEKFRFSVSAEGYEDTGILEGEAAPGTPPQDLNVLLLPLGDSMARVELRLIGPDGKPVEKGKLNRIVVMGDPEQENLAMYSSDHEAPGGLLVLELNPGTHEFTLEAPHTGTDPVVLVFKVGKGERLARDVVFGRTGSVKVVTGSEEWVPIHFYLPDGMRFHPVRNKGSLYGGIEPGEVTVEAELDGERVRKKVTVRTGETTEVRFDGR